jgi:hypothetical protein
MGWIFLLGIFFFKTSWAEENPKMKLTESLKVEKKDSIRYQSIPQKEWLYSLDSVLDMTSFQVDYALSESDFRIGNQIFKSSVGIETLPFCDENFAKLEQLERSEQLEKLEQIDNSKRFDKPEKSENFEKSSLGMNFSPKDFFSFCRLRGESSSRSVSLELNESRAPLSGYLGLKPGESLRIKIHWFQKSLGFVGFLTLPKEEYSGARLVSKKSSLEREGDTEGFSHQPELIVLSQRDEMSYGYPLYKKTPVTGVPLHQSQKSFDDRIQWLRYVKAKKDLSLIPQIPRVREQFPQGVLGSYEKTLKVSFHPEGEKTESSLSFPLDDYGYYDLRYKISSEAASAIVIGEALRQPPREFIVRISGLTSSVNAVLTTGEFSFSHYFASLFNHSFGDWDWNRFGLQVRSFNSLFGLKGFQISEPIDLSLMLVEGRIFLKPGLWNYDEAFGLSFSSSEFTLMGRASSNWGIGFFWGRPMPSTIENVINLVKWFRYPKYVDLDFNYLIPKSSMSFSPQWVGNFRGKLFLKDYLFFDGGLSLMQIQTNRQGYSMSNLGGTLGFGVLF